MNSLHSIRRSLLVALCLFSTVAVSHLPFATGQTSGIGPKDREAPVQPVHTFGKPVFLFETYTFASDRPGMSRLHLYLGFVNDLLQFIKEGDDRFRARYEVSIDILDRERNQIDGKTWRDDLLATSFEETNSRKELHLASAQFDIPPGTYRLRLELIDLDTQSHLRREREIEVPDFSDRNVLQMSDVVFADSVILGGPEGVRFVPNLNRNRDEPEAPFQAFCEIYPSSGFDSVTVTYRILDWRKEPVETTRRRYVGGARTLREVVDLGTKIERPGRYYLHIVVTQGGEKITRDTNFFISRTGDEEEPFRFSANQVTFEPLRYILPKEEFARFVESPEGERQRMVEEFWRARDPDPETEVNELQVEFYRRVHFANEHFSVTSMNKQGWETDRGRIYIIYGQPTEVRQHRLDLDKPPLEVWYYLRDNHRFIFKDKRGTGEYVLIHER